MLPAVIRGIWSCATGACVIRNGRARRLREAGRSPTPVWLDTSIDEGVRAYQAIGFQILGECEVDTGADAEGIKLRRGASEEMKKKARKRSRQWVMLRMPPEEGNDIQE